MTLHETELVNIADLGNSPKARYLYARRMFQTADSSQTPNSQALIDTHAQWLSRELASIGVDAPNQSLYVLFRDSKVSDRKDKPSLRRIETQTRASTNNLLQGLLWYEAPEFASWKQFRMKFISDIALVNQEDAIAYMQKRQVQGGWRISNESSLERYKSLVCGYNPQQSPEAPFTFEVNEHYVGVKGQLDFTNSKKKHFGVNAYFNPVNRLFEVAFEGYSDFIGWDQLADEEPIYRLSYVRKMVRHLYSKIKSGEQDFIQLSTWKAY